MEPPAFDRATENRNASRTGYESSRMTTNIADMRGLSTKFFGSLSDACRKRDDSCLDRKNSVKWRGRRGSFDIGKAYLIK